MLADPILDRLRLRIHRLEEARRVALRVVPIAETVDRRLPQRGLPTGCIHEIKGTSLAAAMGFAAILSGRIAGEEGNILYAAPDRSLCPLGLLPYGVKLDQLLHVSTRRSQDLAWTVMEALRCPQVSAVMAVLDGLDLTECRRLQLAAEGSGATGLFLGNTASAPLAAPITRWKVAPIATKPGQRFDQPVWAIDLLYCRGGRPGRWVLEWHDRTLDEVACGAAKAVPVTATLAPRRTAVGG